MLILRLCIDLAFLNKVFGVDSSGKYLEKQLKENWWRRSDCQAKEFAFYMIDSGVIKWLLRKDVMVQWYFRKTALMAVFSVHEKMASGEGYSSVSSLPMKRLKPELE